MISFLSFLGQNWVKTESKLSPSLVKTDSKLSPSWVQVESKLSKNWVKTESQLSQNWVDTESKLSLNWVKIESKLSLNWVKTESNLSHNWIKTESKLSQNWVKNLQLRNFVFLIVHPCMLKALDFLCWPYLASKLFYRHDWTRLKDIRKLWLRFMEETAPNRMKLVGSEYKLFSSYKSNNTLIFRNSRVWLAYQMPNAKMFGWILSILCIRKLSLKTFKISIYKGSGSNSFDPIWHPKWKIWFIPK